MRDYRDYKQFYINIGFFAIIAGVFLFAFKATSWLIWANQCINAAL